VFRQGIDGWYRGYGTSVMIERSMGEERVYEVKKEAVTKGGIKSSFRFSFYIHYIHQPNPPKSRCLDEWMDGTDGGFAFSQPSGVGERFSICF